MPVAERGVRGSVRLALLKRGYLVDSNPAGPATGRGRSDLTVCAEGFFFAFEVKAPGEQPTPSQLRYLDKVRQAGGVAAVVHSSREAIMVVQEALDVRRNLKN